MKTGKSIQELAQELDRQHKVKRDFLADSQRLSLSSDGRLIMQNGVATILDVNENFHSQLADRLQIPKRYYDKMRDEQPNLLRENVNTWFKAEPKTRMIRTLDGTARAYLSDRYRPLDNYDLAQAVLPTLTKLGADVRSMDVTDTKFYIKAVIPGKTEIIAPEGVNPDTLKFDGSQRDKHIFVDEVEPGIVISNSEVGCGGLNVWPGIHTRRCTNLASFRGDGFSKTHIGSSLSHLLAEGRDLAEYIQDDTRATADELVWKKVRDFVGAACDGSIFETLVNRLRESRGHKIEGHVPKVVEVAGKQFGWSQAEQGGILQHLIEGGELSQYGLSNAVTQYSQREEVSYDRASELEHVGADIIELPTNDWSRIAVAA